MNSPNKDTPQHTKVVYVPLHAHGDFTHEDCEIGFVSSCNDSGAFIKIGKHLARHGWEGTTSQHCDFDKLVVVK